MKHVVFIGNLAFQAETTLAGKNITQFTGSSYYTSISAALISKNIGIVSRVGKDIQKNNLKGIFPNLEGISASTKFNTARFVVKEYKSSRKFYEELGASQEIDTSSFPKQYLKTHFIHLATMLPQIQLQWISFLRRRLPKSTHLSADLFENYTKKYSQESLEVTSLVDLVFLNQEEYLNLTKANSNFLKNKTYILKMGSKGATYNSAIKRFRTSTSKVKVINTSGAGEVLAAVFLTLRAKGIPIKESLSVAVKIASLSVIQVGVDHLHSNKEVSELVSKYL